MRANIDCQEGSERGEGGGEPFFFTFLEESDHLEDQTGPAIPCLSAVPVEVNGVD